MQTAKQLFIVIVTWNGQKFIRDCLNSIFSQKTSDYGVIVVDNNSTDETKSIVSNEYKDVVLIVNSRNVGFAAANNQGIDKAIDLGAEYMVLLNQDTEVSDNLVQAGLKYFQENTKIGLASPIIYFPKENRIWFAGSKIYRGKEILTHPTSKLGKHINKKQILSKDDKYNSVDWIPGCTLFIRKEVIKKIGKLDEKFFMYGEDIDFSFRAQKAGINMGIFDTTSVIHKERLNRKLEISSVIFKKMILMTKSRYTIVSRYFSLKEKCYYLIKLVYTPLFQLVYVFRKIFS